MKDEEKNTALKAEKDHTSAVEPAYDYLEHFDILETITNVGNDEVFTPRKTCDMILNSLPEDVWHHPEYKWLNPATKNGVFEREIALRLDKGLKDIIPDEETRRKHILQNMIYSIGLTRFTANVARRTLYYCSQANRKCDGIKAEDGHYVNGFAIGNGTWFDDKEGNIKTPRTEHSFDSSGKCKYCGISSNSKYNSSDQREHYAYEFIHHGKLSLERNLQDLFFKGDRNMKFDVIIGNPPYMLTDGGGTGDSAKPIYNLFVDMARELNPRYMSFVIPSRWMKGGKGLDQFRASMIEDTHIKFIHDYEDCRICFPNNTIDGGVCYFVWDSNYQGKVDYHYTSADGKEHVSSRYLKTNVSSTVIRDVRQLSILEKIHNKGYESFSKLVSYRNNYGFNSDFFNKQQNESDKNYAEQPFENSIKIYGIQGKKGGSKRVSGYIKNSMLKKDRESLDKYKLFFSKAYMTTATVPPEIISGGVNEICTETFLMIGPWDTKEEQQNCLNYIKTKFFRALLFYNRHSLNISKESFELIPLLDFSKTYTDSSLYELFGLNDEEIKFIEENIQEMK